MASPSAGHICTTSGSLPAATVEKGRSRLRQRFRYMADRGPVTLAPCDVLAQGQPRDRRCRLCGPCGRTGKTFPSDSNPCRSTRPFRSPASSVVLAGHPHDAYADFVGSSNTRDLAQLIVRIFANGALHDRRRTYRRYRLSGFYGSCRSGRGSGLLGALPRCPAWLPRDPIQPSASRGPAGPASRLVVARCRLRYRDFTREVATVVSPDGRVTGCDLSEAMLGVANSRAAEAGPTSTTTLATRLLCPLRPGHSMLAEPSAFCNTWPTPPKPSPRWSGSPVRAAGRRHRGRLGAASRYRRPGSQHLAPNDPGDQRRHRQWLAGSRASPALPRRRSGRRHVRGRDRRHHGREHHARRPGRTTLDRTGARRRSNQRGRD